MSTRAMGRMYSGGGYNTGMGGGDGGLLDLIANLAGQNNVSGGPTFDPATRQFTYQPFSGGKGFLGSKSRRRAADMNALVGGQGFLQQQEGEIAAKARAQEGDETRKTQAERSEQKINEENAAATAKVLGEMGLPPQAINMFMDRIVAHKVRSAEQRAQQESENLDSPEGQRAFKTGLNAGYKKQDYENRSKTKLEAVPGGIATMEGVGTLRGGTRKDSIEGGFPYKDPKTGQVTMIGGHPVNTMSAGTFTPAVDPSLMDEMPPPEPSPSNASPSKDSADEPTTVNSASPTAGAALGGFGTQKAVPFGGFDPNVQLVQPKINPMEMTPDENGMIGGPPKRTALTPGQPQQPNPLDPEMLLELLRRKRSLSGMGSGLMMPP